MIYDTSVLFFAGGYGTRLRPLTENTPKPLTPVRGVPVMQSMISRLVNRGITNVYIAIYHQGAQIRNWFGDGSDFGARISYINESGGDLKRNGDGQVITLSGVREPMGTAGALRWSAFSKLSEPLITINGDVISGFDPHALLQAHKECEADVTVVTFDYQYTIPYGLVETDSNGLVRAMTEKPSRSVPIATGINVFGPRALEHARELPPGPIDMPKFIRSCLDAHMTVIGWDQDAYWSDIGSLADLRWANMQE